jgi:hypothetical protein
MAQETASINTLLESYGLARSPSWRGLVATPLDMYDKQ